MARRVFLSLCLAAASNLVACRRAPSAAPIPVPVAAASACPAPDLHRRDWVFVPDSSGFTLALPAGFAELPSGGSFRHWDAADSRSSISFGIIRGDLGLPGYRRVYQPEIMREYSECVETVSGYPMYIQAWRTPNGVFRDFKRFDRYDVFSIWEVRPGVYAYITGGTDARPSQELILRAIRLWRRR